MKTIAVIGGGAAGMIAAGKSAELGNNVILFEKNDRTGKKLLITGKGRCNVTNACDVTELVQNICGNPRFMYSSISQFDSFAVVDFFAGLGVETKVERGNRVFPVSDNARDIADALVRYMKKNGVKTVLNAAVIEIAAEGGCVKGVVTKDGFTAADSVIVATGGLSYPGTGSTGDGYRFAKAFSHNVTKLYPSLVPLTAREDWIPELQGLSLKNVSVTLKDGNSVLYRDFGEMLFTHYGLSGPVILSASRYVLGKYDSGCKLEIDLKPALDEEQLDRRLIRDFEQFSLKAYKNSLSELLPQKLIPVIVKLSGINENKKCCEITREERRCLGALLKSLTVTIAGARGFNEAVITVGGVDVKEINPKTMESKLVKGLFFCGEVLDVDAYTGGFNLQIAFSTGIAAGKHA